MADGGPLAAARARGTRRGGVLFGRGASREPSSARRGRGSGGGGLGEGGGTNAPAATISAQAATGGALRWPGLAKGSRWGLRRQPVRAMRNGARGGHGSAFKVARLAPGSRRGREQVADRCGRGVERSWRRRRLAQPAWAASSRSCAGRQRAREREGRAAGDLNK
jgi:hypothetical protein